MQKVSKHADGVFPGEKAPHLLLPSFCTRDTWQSGAAMSGLWASQQGVFLALLPEKLKCATMDV